MSDRPEENSAAIRLAESFAKRINEAIRLPFKSVRIGDWVPAPRNCHDNVALWVEHNPTHRQIFGCISQPILDTVVRLTPHSAVQNEDGAFFDITPNDWSDWVWFIPHIGTAEEFAPLARMPEVEVPLVSDC